MCGLFRGGKGGGELIYIVYLFFVVCVVVYCYINRRGKCPRGSRWWVRGCGSPLVHAPIELLPRCYRHEEDVEVDE